jgi:CheY-like chemotaxis protein
MSSALICSYLSFEEDLRDTFLWRDEIVRRFAGSTDEAYESAQTDKPDLLVVDRDLPAVVRLIRDIRRNPDTRQMSIVAVARTDFEPIEVEILDAGANAVLRLPAVPEWDERLARLFHVPARRDVRLSISFEMEARTGNGILTLTGTANNLCVHGILLETDSDLRVGDDIDLRFNLPGTDSLIVGCGRVIRQDSRRRYGIEFYGLEGDGAEQVRSYVARYRAGGWESGS